MSIYPVVNKYIILMVNCKIAKKLLNNPYGHSNSNFSFTNTTNMMVKAQNTGKLCNLN